MSSNKSIFLAVVLGGLIQIVFGILKAGVIGYYFPSSVIKGMLTGIGIIIILKQIPHFFGYDADPEGDFAFSQIDGHNTFSEIGYMLENINLGSTIIAVIGLAILLLWDKVLSSRGKFFKIVQGPLVAVVLGIIYYIATGSSESYGISTEHLVQVPVPTDFDSFLGQFSLPNFGAITNPAIWVTAFTIALVASLETLLCVEATDKLDPEFLLLISVVLIPGILNMIPLSVLAAILLIVGFKLAKPGLFATMYKLGWKQFLPFIVTVMGIILTRVIKTLIFFICKIRVMVKLNLR